MNKHKIPEIFQIINNLIKVISLPDYEGAPTEDYSDYFWPSRDVTCCTGSARCCNTPARIVSHVEKQNRKVMVQAGGNAGYFLRKYAAEFQTVYTFEPDPINFLCLSLNTILTDNVIKFQACLGDTHQLVSIKNQHFHDTGGIHITPNEEIENTYRSIPTMTIDDLNLDECNLIQLDVEGYEYYALKGAEKTIEKFKPVICVEYYEDWTKRYSENRLREIEMFLSKWNYTFVDTFETDRVYKVL